MKKKLYIILLIASILSGSIIGYKIAESRHDMYVYKLETTTDDSLLILENMKLVSCGTNLYVEPGFLIRKSSGSNIKIDGLKLNITIGKSTITNLTLSTSLRDNDQYVSDGYTLLKDINIDKNSMANVHFNYIIGGQTYDSYRDVILQQDL